MPQCKACCVDAQFLFIVHDNSVSICCNSDFQKFKPQRRAKKSRPEGHHEVIERPDMEQINPQRNRVADDNNPLVVVINEREPLKETASSKDSIKKQPKSVTSEKNSAGSSSDSESDSNSKSENTASITHEPKPPSGPKVSPRPTLSLRGRVSLKPPNDPKPTSPTKLTPEPTAAEVTPPIEQPRVHPPGEAKPVFPVPKSPNNTTIEISDLSTSANVPIPRQQTSETTLKPTPPDEPDSDAENKPNFKRTSPRFRPRKSEPKSPTEKSESKTPNARMANILTKSKSRSKESSSSDSEPENKPDDQPKPKVAFKPPVVQFRPGARMPRPPVAQNLANKPKRQSTHSSDSETGNDLSESKIVSKSPQPASTREVKPRSGGRRSRPRLSGTQNAQKSKITSLSSSDSETEKPKDQNITNVAQAVRIQTEPKSPPGNLLRRSPSKKGPSPNPGDAQLQPWAEKRPLPQSDADPYNAMIRRKSEITSTPAEPENVPRRPLSSTFDKKPSVKPKPFMKRPTFLSIPPPKPSSSSENESPSPSPIKPAIPKKPSIKKPQSPTQVRFEDGTQTTVSVPSPGVNLDRSLSNKYKPPSQKKSDTAVPVLLKVTNKDSSRNLPTTP